MKRFKIEQILKSIRYKSWQFYLSADASYIQVKFEGPCSVDGDMKEQSGRKWRISEHMTKSEIVTTAFKAVITAEEHEVREHFKYQGEPIFGPHYDVDALANLCKQKRFDVREEQ